MENEQIEVGKRELLNYNKENMNSWTNVLGTEEQPSKKASEKIVIYEIQKCKPHR